jgi:hypothetical protein
MSVRHDEWTSTKKNPNYNIENSEMNSKEKSDYCNLNIATFTFGGNKGEGVAKGLQLNTIEKDPMEGMNTNANLKKHNSMKKLTTTDERLEQKDLSGAGGLYKDKYSDVGKYKNNKIEFTNSQINPHFSSFINKIGAHNSFLSVIIHAFWNMKIFRNYLMNDLLDISEKDPKSKLLWYLRNILMKYPENKKIDITKLRNSLADLFQNRRKFLIDQPDDPVDCYFAIVNSIHSHFMVK